MTTESTAPVPAEPDESPPVLAARNVNKSFGPVDALLDVNVSLNAGEVTCVVGDNGAGKSVFIKILCGLLPPTSGEILLDGTPIDLASPRHARSLGIVAVYQDLALAPLMSVWRNFFLGAEPVKGWGPFQRFDIGYAKETVTTELEKLGVELGDPERAAYTLSGGQRQGLAIARALYYGARVLILDEPTAALGVRQSGAVLRLIRRVAQRGAAVVLVTPKPEHAFWVGDRYLIFQRGRLVEDRLKGSLTLQELAHGMAGGGEIEELEHVIAGT